MRIRKATFLDKKILHQDWKTVFSHDDFGSIDYYFQKRFNPSNCYILEENKQIISSLMVHPHDMVLHQKIVKVAYIVGVYTRPDYQHKGYMKTLMNYVLKELEQTYLLTLIQGYSPEIYEPFGFESVYEQNVYELRRSMIRPMDSHGVKLRLDPKDLLETYLYYAQYFTGYFTRDEAYYLEMMDCVKAENGEYIGVYSDQDLRAYTRLVRHEQKVIVDEVVYKDTQSLVKLLSFILTQDPKIEVRMTAVDNLSKIIEKAFPVKEKNLMVKLNDYNLFERLFHVKVSTASSAMKVFSKPLFNGESY